MRFLGHLSRPTELGTFIQRLAPHTRPPPRPPPIYTSTRRAPSPPTTDCCPVWHSRHRGNPQHRKKKKKAIGMASLAMGFGATAAAGGRGAALAARAATKSAGESSEEKGLLDWILGGLQKDQLVETDPILNKVEDKSGGSTSRSRGGTTSVTVPKKNSGGFGGLFAKK